MIVDADVPAKADVVTAHAQISRRAMSWIHGIHDIAFHAGISLWHVRGNYLPARSVGSTHSGESRPVNPRRTLLRKGIDDPTCTGITTDSKLVPPLACVGHRR